MHVNPRARFKAMREGNYTLNGEGNIKWTKEKNKIKLLDLNTLLSNLDKSHHNNNAALLVK